MSDIDSMNSLVTTAGGTPDTYSQTGVSIKDVPANYGNGTPFKVQLDQNGGFWWIYDSSAYVVQRGQGSVQLQDTMRRLGMI